MLNAIIIFFICLKFERFISILYNSSLKAMKFISMHPFDIKLDNIIMSTLYKYLLVMKSFPLKNGCTLVDNFQSLFFFAKVSCKFIFILYSYTFKVLTEILDLLINRTYNSKMKRYDTIYLKSDQIVLAVGSLCLIVLFYTNIVFYYVYTTIEYSIIYIIEYSIVIHNVPRILVDFKNIWNRKGAIARKIINGTLYLSANE